MEQDPQEMWAQCLLSIEQRVRPVSFKTWFRPTQASIFNEEKIVLEVPSSYFAEWVESNYLALIEKVILEETELSPEISFRVVEEKEEKESKLEEPETQEEQQAAKVEQTELPLAQKTEQKGPDPVQPTSLDRRYTFDSFVIGEGNRMAHAAAMAVAKSPGNTQFNPLVIYGGVGLGKTHLLQAIGAHAQANNRDTKVVFVTSEKLMSSLIEAIRTHKTAEFKRLYRSTDILLVDDIQFMIKGEFLQEEFFHTFNALHTAGKQIAMTCDSPPNKLEGLEERLISRFQWGLVTNIEPPDLETRIAILHQKADIHGIQLPEDAANYLGNYISSNIRELEGALNHLMAYCAVNQMELSVEAARRIVKERTPQRGSDLSIEAIQKSVAEHFGLSPELLIGKTRKQEVATARQIAMFLAKQLTQNPLRIIGFHFGNRDHSTVIHAVNTVEEKRKKDPTLDKVVESLIRELKGEPEDEI